MYEDPEHEDYDDDEYNYYPEHSGYGYSESAKKFNIDWAAWEQWLSKAIKEIVEEDNNVWVFGHQLTSENKINSVKKSTLGDKFFIYLGSNYDEDAIWKTKYFINNKLDQIYKNHISSNAAHFVRQPVYYKGMFDNLN